MPASSTTRTVAEVMSAPAITALSSETVAEASGRMVAHSVGSVVVVDGERPIGILTERDLVRFGAAGAAAADTKVSEWMTEAPDCVAPSISVQEAVHGPGRPRVPPPPRHRGRSSGRHRVAARPHGRGPHPACRAPLDHRGAARARGRDRGRDLGRRRPRPGGLLPLPPVQRRRAGRQAPARGRVVPAVRGPPPHGRRARRVHGRDRAVAARCRSRSSGCSRRWRRRARP